MPGREHGCGRGVAGVCISAGREEWQQSDAGSVPSLRDSDIFHALTQDFVLG